MCRLYGETFQTSDKLATHGFLGSVTTKKDLLKYSKSYMHHPEVMCDKKRTIAVCKPLDEGKLTGPKAEDDGLQRKMKGAY